MIGIRSFGGYVPRYRLNRMIIFGSMGWINPATIMNARGEKAVANFDEDAITMAVAAGRDCLSGMGRESIDAVYFASTTAPYKERQNANIVAGAMETKDQVRTADFGGSLKAGSTALLSALDAVGSEDMGDVMVCASDMRLGKMGTPQELIFGDGGAAFLVSDQDVVAEFKGQFSLACDFVDHLRGANAKYDRQWEDRWIRDMGFTKFIPQAIRGLCEKYGLDLAEFSKVIYPCHYGGARKKLNKMLELDPEKVQDNMLGVIGDVGTAQTLMMFVSALEEANPGDKLLLVSYGNGCDAMFFEVTDNIKKLADRKGIGGHLANRVELDNYLKYLAWRRMIPADVGMRGEEDRWTRWSMVWRSEKMILGMLGSKCTKCGTQHFPAQRVCVNPDCGAIDEMEAVYVSEKGGKIFSYTGDMLAASINPPAIYGNVDINGGGRFMMDFTDCVVDDLKVGNPVEFSFRIKYYDPDRDITTYFWKAVPVLEGAPEEEEA